MIIMPVSGVPGPESRLSMGESDSSLGINAGTFFKKEVYCYYVVPVNLFDCLL